MNALKQTTMKCLLSIPTEPLFCQRIPSSDRKQEQESAVSTNTSS